MNFIIIVQARMGSSRLPGKSFFKIGDKSLIDYLIEILLKEVPRNKVVLATSMNKENDVLREYAKEKGIECFSGDENNVASRFKSVLEKHNSIDYFFRICGDSPYYDFDVIRQAIKFVDCNNVEIVTSMSNRGYPMGANVEMIKKSTFLLNYANFESEDHFEHVTSYFYQNIKKFKFKELSCGVENFNYNEYKFSVDTKEDYDLAKKMLKVMSFNPWNYSFKQKIEIQKKIKNDEHNI